MKDLYLLYVAKVGDMKHIVIQILKYLENFYICWRMEQTPFWP